MNETTLYYIWLLKSLGQAHSKIKIIFRHFGDVKSIYDAKPKEHIQSGLFTPKQLERLSDKSLDHAKKVYEYCYKHNQKIITLTSRDYPKRLGQIFDPPILLFAEGNISDIENYPCIAVVGSRKSTEYGNEIAYKLSRDLARAGAIIVSGCAVGIDTASHRGALAADGKTVGILGCGIDYPYNMANKNLRDDITVRGAVLSEHFPDTPPSKYTFPVRNRIMSGISNGVLIVEAGEKSGSLITARLALEQGKDVFSVPGSLLSEFSNGTNTLLKDGAIPVTGAMDILLEYANYYRDSINLSFDMQPLDAQSPVCEKPKDEKVNENLTFISSEARELYDIISDSPVHVDELSIKTSKPVHVLLARLTELEMAGLITPCPGKLYKRGG